MLLLSTLGQFFDTILLWFVNLLPESSGLPEGITDALQRLIGLLYNFDFIVPVTLLLEALQFMVVFHVGIALYRLVAWVIRLVRGN